MAHGEPKKKGTVRADRFLWPVWLLFFLLGFGKPAAAREYPPCEPIFSLEAGAYPEESVTLELSAPAGYAIYYTTDGSIPTESSPRYERPLTLRSPGPREDDLSAKDNAAQQLFSEKQQLRQDKTLPSAVTLRAVAAAPDGTLGKTITKSYFTGILFTEHYPGLAVISLVTDDRNLLDDEMGIFVKGREWERWIATPEGQEILAEKRSWEYEGNFSQRGRAWERRASMELFDGTDTLTLQENIGVRVHGKATRACPQKSLNVYLRGEYGKAQLDYALIPSAMNSAGNTITVFQSFVLRNGGNDWERLKFKDEFLQKLLSERRFAVQAVRPAVVFINGEYWGVYTLCEKYGKSYIEQHYPGISPDNVVMIKDGELDEGKNKDVFLYQELMALAQRDLSEAENWERFKAVVDTENMADYFAAQVYIANYDWREDKNYRLWRTRTPGLTHEYDDGRWRFLLYDTEYSSSFYSQKETAAEWDSFQEAMGNHPLFAATMKNPEFQSLFLTALREIGRVDCAPERVHDLLARYASERAPLMEEQYRRFGDTSYYWESSLRRIEDFFDRRFDYITRYVEEWIASTVGEHSNGTKSIKSTP